VTTSTKSPSSVRPTRRRFTVEQKLRILAEYEAAGTPEARGAVLRREGIYSSHIALWRQKRDGAEKPLSIASVAPSPTLVPASWNGCAARANGYSSATRNLRRLLRSREKCRRSCKSSGARRPRRRPSHHGGSDERAA